MNPGENHWKGRTLCFLASQSITLFGSTLVQMAMVWYVTLETASGAWVAAFTICSYLPQFLISFPGGVWADRYSRKKLIIGADAMIAAVTLALVLAMPRLKDRPVLLGMLLLASVLRSLGAGVQTPAVNAVIPQLVPQEQLMRYNGINAAMQSAVQFAAPAAAGILLTASTLRASLLADILTAALGIGLLGGIPIPEPPSQWKERTVLTDMKRGVHYARSQPLIGRLLIVYGLFVFLCVPAGFLAQLLVSRVYGGTYWHLTAVEVTGFAGMAAGGALMGVWGGFQRREKTLWCGLVAFGLLAIGMGISRRFGLYLLLMLLYGVALTMVQTSVTTLIQERADRSLQGRVFGLQSSMYAGFLPAGMAVFGPMADLVPLQWLMAGSGAALLAVAAAVQRDKHFRQEKDCFL